MRLSIHNGFSYGFNLFEAYDCDGGTSNHQAHIHNEEEMEKLVSQRTLWESPMRNLQQEKKDRFMKHNFNALFYKQFQNEKKYRQKVHR